MLQSPTLAPETPCGLLSRLLVFIATVFCTRARTQLYELRAKDFKLELLPAGSRDYGGCWRLVLNETLSKTNQLKYATALAPVREPPFAIMDPNDESIVPTNNVVALYMRYTKKLPPVEQRKTDRFFLQPIAIEPAVRPLVVLLPCGYAPPPSFDSCCLWLAGGVAEYSRVVPEDPSWCAQPREHLQARGSACAACAAPAGRASCWGRRLRAHIEHFSPCDGDDEPHGTWR